MAESPLTQHLRETIVQLKRRTDPGTIQLVANLQRALASLENQPALQSAGAPPTACPCCGQPF